MKLHLRFSVACTAALVVAFSLSAGGPAGRAALYDQPAAAGWSRAAAGGRPCRLLRALAAERSRSGGQRPLRCESSGARAVRSEGHARGTAGVPAVGAGQDEIDDADGSRTVEVVRQLHATRLARDLAPEPVFDHARAHAEDAGATVRGSQQLAHHSHGRPARSKEPRAMVPRHERRSLGG